MDVTNSSLDRRKGPKPSQGGSPGERQRPVPPRQDIPDEDRCTVLTCFKPRFGHSKWCLTHDRRARVAGL